MSFIPSKTKSDALRRLGDLLGQKFDLAKGSTIPSALFTAATQLAQVSDAGQMPQRAERVVLKAGISWDERCDSRHTPSGGGATVTLTGLNRLLEALGTLKSAAKATNLETEPEQFGVPYVTAQGAVTATPKEFTADWDKLDKSTQAHHALQNRLADFVNQRGIDPKSPNNNEPPFDLAWEYDGLTVVVEVKSANESNHRQQARLGFAQVLEYAARLEDQAPGCYRPVLLIERSPELFDYLLAAHTGVVVIGPEQFVHLELEDLLPMGHAVN